jgi:hypothetical protein
LRWSRRQWATLPCTLGAHPPLLLAHACPPFHKHQQATEDEESRDEKIKRASFDIKSAHATGSPPTRRVVSPAAWAQSPPTPPAHSTAIGAPRQQQEQQQQEQQPQQQQGVSQPLVLTPQEVLQELLGDMYIDQSRLTMGK